MATVERRYDETLSLSGSYAIIWLLNIIEEGVKLNPWRFRVSYRTSICALKSMQYIFYMINF